MNKAIMIVGVGGQGTLLASRILGSALLSQGYDVKVSEVHGMSQRGGSVVTYVKYGEKVYSPVVGEGEADLILAEDTRTSSVLLKHFEIKGRLESHHKFNEHKTASIIKERILAGLNVALISDAGTPGISDPGFLLVRTCAQEGIEIQTLPGATAFVPALVSSGYPCDRFCFEGFLPQKKGRQTRLTELAEETRTMIFYESPYRLVKTLDQFAEFFGNERECSVAREISKKFEEHKRGSLKDVADWYREHEPKGEIVIIVAGAPEKKKSDNKKQKFRKETENCDE